MNTKDKVSYLYSRHLKLIIEWGGIENFTQCCDLEQDIAQKFLERFFSARNENELEVAIQRAVNEQYERESR